VQPPPKKEYAEPPPKKEYAEPSPKVEPPGPPSQTTRDPTIDVKLNGKTWRIELNPVPIATGAGIALLLSLLALWPRRKELSAEDLRRFGIVCQAEPDQGGQAITHLETPPLGPRITVRTTPGSRRHGIVMH
jgi:hypothetical protein